MKNKYKISIIVPIYNAEKYLEKSIKSIQNQKLNDIQIILVNDGSTDSSLSICQELEKNDDRIFVIDKLNGGVSSARNAGISASTGEFIGFVDPDDWIETEMYSSMYNQAKKHNLDIVMCNYINQYKDHLSPSTIEIEDEVISKKEVINKLIANMLSSPTLNSKSETIAGTVWRMIIKRELIHKYDYRFDEKLSLMEDLVFVVEVLLRVDSVAINKNYFYYYCRYPSSFGNKYRNNYVEINDYVNNKLEQIAAEQNVSQVLQDRMNMRYINSKLNSIVNETNVYNLKSITNKFAAIKKICNDDKIESILNEINFEGYTLRKRFILNALKKKYTTALLTYYTLVNRIN